MITLIEESLGEAPCLWLSTRSCEAQEWSFLCVEDIIKGKNSLIFYDYEHCGRSGGEQLSIVYLVSVTKSIIESI